MKIIFLGRNPVQAAMVVAQIYLGSRPSLEQWASLADLPRPHLLSGPIYIGSDRAGNQVYTLGGGKDLWMVKRSIEDLRNILGFRSGDLVVESVATRWDLILGWLSQVPWPWGGSYLNFLVGQILWRFQHKVLERAAAQVRQG